MTALRSVLCTNGITNNQLTMKTTFSRALLLLATVSSLGFANAAEPLRINSGAAKRSAMERSLDRALSDQLSYPILEKGDMSGEVYVSFAIDKEGRIEVLECSSANEQLKAYVLRKLARICIGENPEGSWKTTYIRFNFHPEKA